MQNNKPQDEDRYTMGALEQLGITTGSEFDPDDATAMLLTIPGRGWMVIVRLYGPTKEVFDGSWKLGDIKQLI